jgi:ABC-type transporter Mla subunit MlaD
VSNYQTTQRRRNITVGLFVIIAIIALGWLIAKFGELPLAVSRMNSYKISIQFPKATGLHENTPVRFAGYQIGRVTRIIPPTKPIEDMETGKRYHQTVAECSINKKFNTIPENIEAKIMSRGLGSSYITLEPEHYDGNEPSTKYLQEGSELQGSTGVTSEFFPEESQEKLDQLITGLQSLIKNANDIIGDPNTKTNIKKTLANVTDATAKATDALEEFRKLSKTGSETLKNTDERMEKVTKSMLDVSKNLSDTLSKTRSILTKVESGQGTASRILNDGKLYESLLENSNQLELMLKDMRKFIEGMKQDGVPIKLK